MNARRLAVHRLPRAHDLRAVRGTDRLVAEADAEDRNAGTELTNDIDRNAGFGGQARAGRDDDVRGRERADLVERDRVVPDDYGMLAELANVSREVVDERVVVVEKENHAVHGPRGRSILRSGRSGRESANERASLVEGLAVFLLGIGVGYDATACGKVYPPVDSLIGADDDTGVHDARDGDVADRATIDAPPRRLELGDNLHGAHFRCAGDRTAGEGGAQDVDGVATGLERARNGGHEMVDCRVALEREQLGDAHAAGERHAGEVVPHEVDDHQVFCSILDALLEGAAERGIVRGIDAPGAGALDRAGFDLARGVQAQEALGRRAGDRDGAELEVGGEGRGVDAAQPSIERPRRFGEWGLEALGEIGLEDVSGHDVFAHVRESVEVASVRERGAEIEGRRDVRVGNRVRWRGLEWVRVRARDIKCR